MLYDGQVIFENGESYRGKIFGDTSIGKSKVAELVFNTSMTGYQEVITDPSYLFQHVILTYPLIGNYGINESFSESSQVHASSLIVKSICHQPSHWKSKKSLPDFLKEQKVIGLAEVDTRYLVQKIRDLGSCKAIIASLDYNANDLIQEIAETKINSHVKNVSQQFLQTYQNHHSKQMHIALWDFGYKKNILNELLKRNFKVTIIPHNVKADFILSQNIDGLILSNGPGDPSELVDVIAQIKLLVGKIPIFGICLGHQLIALASGAKTTKMRFGHRGANHPVRDLFTGKTHISSQNHGYEVLKQTLPINFQLYFENVNDNSVEGIVALDSPTFSVQFHPESSPGPHDTSYLFEIFSKLINDYKNGIYDEKNYGHRLWSNNNWPSS